MASHKSALKRARQNEKRRARNITVRSTTRTLVKKAVETMLSAKTREEALKALSAGGKALQKAVSKGVLPKARASRQISRLAQQINSKFAS